MKKYFKGKIILPVLATGFLFCGVSFKNDFLKLPNKLKSSQDFFKTVNQNYVDETNPGEMMDNAIKKHVERIGPLYMVSLTNKTF